MNAAPVGWAARVALTVGCAAAGVAAFALGDLPLPFLLGPLAACLLAALAGAPLAGTGRAGLVVRMVLGVAIGAAITPEVADRAPQMAASLVLIPLSLAITALVGVPFFRRVCGFDPATAWFAAMPGGLTEMVLLGRDAGGDLRALTLIHATRLLVIVAAAPLILAQGFGAALDGAPGAPAASLPPAQMALMAAAAVIGWRVAAQVGLFGAAIFGPMILAAALSVGGVLTHRPPAEAILAAQFVIGIGVGAGYAGVTLAEVRRDVAAGLAYTAFIAALAAGFAEAVIALGLAPPIDGFLAFAPGGQAEMVVLAIILGADVGYVVVHHLTRLVLIVAGAPLLARWLGVGGRPRNPGGPPRP